MVKNLPAHAGDSRFDPWVGKIPWRRKWQPTPVFLPGKSHGQRSLGGQSGSQRVRHNWANENTCRLITCGHSCFPHSLSWFMASYPKRIYFNPGRNISVISFGVCGCGCVCVCVCVCVFVFNVIFVLLLLFYRCSAACGTLVSRPGIEPILPYIGSMKFWPLDHQGSPCLVLFFSSAGPF